MNELEPVVKDLPKVPEFYRGRSIFLTGFSGFLGNVTVEKLLWSCPDIKAIYVLLRVKRGLSCDERLKNILDTDCFDRVRKHKEETLKKIIPIQGDALLPGLGISEEDRYKLISDVDIVIHSAASIRFDDPLTLAMDLNFIGTKSMLDLATQMKKLEVFTYISTAYANCDKLVIEEKMYEPHADWSLMLKVRDKIDESVLNTLSAKCCDRLPNTYAFTKSLAEHMVYDYSQRIPIVIFRPSIVTNSITEPIPGWILSINSPSSQFVGYATGIIKTSIQNGEHRLDFVPCDFVIRLLLMAILLKPNQRKGMTPIYNVTSNEKSPTSNEIVRMCKEIWKHYPIKYSLGVPNFAFTTSYTKYYIQFLLWQLFPSVLIDIILKWMGKEIRLVNIQRKIYLAMISLTRFVLNEFKFSNQYCDTLQNYIHPDDKEEFNSVTEDFNLEDYMIKMHIYMVQKFLNQTLDDYEIARRNYNVILIADSIIKYGFFILCGWLVYKHEIVQTLTNSTIDFIMNF